VLVVDGLFVQREFVASGDPDIGAIDTHRPEVGRTAPDFRVEMLDGSVAQLSDFRGQTVLLNFWATWCGPCRAEMPEFQEVYDVRLPLDDFVVLAVDVGEGPAVITAFIDELALTFPVALDPAGDVARLHGVRGLPATFFIDRHGVLRHQMLGPVFGNLLPDGIRRADEAGG
jgi:peroxiredoxin